MANLGTQTLTSFGSSCSRRRNVDQPRERSYHEQDQSWMSAIYFYIKPVYESQLFPISNFSSEVVIRGAILLAIYSLINYGRQPICARAQTQKAVQLENKCYCMRVRFETQRNKRRRCWWPCSVRARSISHHWTLHNMFGLASVRLERASECLGLPAHPYSSWKCY